MFRNWGTDHKETDTLIETACVSVNILWTLALNFKKSNIYTNKNDRRYFDCIETVSVKYFKKRFSPDRRTACIQ